MKVNESTNATNLLMVGMQAQKSVSGTSMDFASVLSDTADTNNSMSVEQNNEKNAVEKENNSIKRQDVSEPVKQRSSDDTVQAVDEKHTVENESVIEKTESVDETPIYGEKDISEDMEHIIEVLGSLLNDLSEILNVSVEDLSKVMDEMGLSANDLLDIDSMKHLLLTIREADSTDLLMNEDLNNQFQTIVDAIGESREMLSDLPLDAFEMVSITTLVDSISETPDWNPTEFSAENSDAIMPDMVSDNETEEPVVIIEDNRKDFLNQNDKNNQTKQSDVPDIKLDNKIPVSTQPKGNEKGFENPILQNIQDSLHQIEESIVAPDRPTVSSTQVMEQIVEQVKVQMNQDNTTLQMQLYPEHLGRIQINVVSKEGVMTAQIVAENDAAKQAIEGGLASLKETLENQNIKVEAVEVMVSTTGFQQNDEKSGFSDERSHTKKSRKIDLSNLEEEDLEIEDMGEVEKMKVTGSSVSYSV